MKRNEHYFLRQIADTFFLVPSDEIQHEEKKMVFLNETGAFLWKAIGSGCTTEDLEMNLLKEYGVPEETAYRDIQEFIFFLSENGCLDLETEI